MLVYILGDQLELVTPKEVLENGIPAVFLTTSKECKDILAKVGIHFDGDVELEEIYFCKVETQQDSVYGTLCVPRLLDVLGSRYKLQFFINEKYIVIADNDDFAERLVRRVIKRRPQQGPTKERFLYNFITEFLNRDLSLLNRYEKQIMRMEDEIMHGKTEDFQSKLMPIRKELLTLRGYYDELCDLGQELEENETGFFDPDQLKYFGTVTNRADRLMNKTMHLIEYAMQVRDAYQSQIDAKQNNTMQYLSVISTIFFPLTLITGWYGMNFKDMPGLEGGYPGVVVLSVIVVLVCVFIFKRKDML